LKGPAVKRRSGVKDWLELGQLKFKEAYHPSGGAGLLEKPKYRETEGPNKRSHNWYASTGNWATRKRLEGNLVTDTAFEL
jgi:hypothetical protein